MRHYAPATPELLAAVAEFLEKIAPRLDSGERYHALVCRHLLAMVQRELTEPPLADEDEAGLAAAIRAGWHDGEEEALLEALLARTIDRVRIAKPDHLVAGHR